MVPPRGCPSFLWYVLRSIIYTPPCDAHSQSFIVLSSHVDIDFAAPAGPNPPVDESSIKVSPSVHPSPSLYTALFPEEHSELIQIVI